MKTGAPLFSLMLVAFVVAAILGQKKSDPALLTTGVDAAGHGPSSEISHGPELLAAVDAGHGPPGINNDQPLMSPRASAAQPQLRGLSIGKHPQERQLQTSGVWSAFGQPVHGDATLDRMGKSMDMSSDGRTIVGCSQDKPCKVFAYDGSDHLQKGSTITPPNPGIHFANNDVRLSSNGQRLAVGAYIASANGLSQNGCICVYDFVGADWQLTCSPCGIVDSARIGYSLAMSKDGTLTAGGGCGRVEVFKESSGSWSKQVLTGSAIEFECHGVSVALNAAGDTLAVGETACNACQGRVHALRHDGSTWNSVGVVDGRFGVGSCYGISMALATVGSTTTMVACAFVAAGGGSQRGQAPTVTPRMFRYKLKSHSQRCSEFFSSFVNSELLMCTQTLAGLDGRTIRTF